MYVAAAYSLVIGLILAYGWSVLARRRAVDREARDLEAARRNRPPE